MKIQLKTAALVLLLSTISHQLSTALAQGTAFTYQGRLNNNGAPANGSYDLTFSLFATNSTGTALVGPVTNTATVVTNGLFITSINFGNAFTGSSNWLEIAVRTNGSGAFSTLVPRQQLTPVPYAITAASLSGGIGASQLTSGTVPNNVIAGFQGPFFAAVGGGQANFVDGQYDVLGGGLDNLVQNSYGVVGGGYANDAGPGFYISIGGGNGNNASSEGATVPGGVSNTVAEIFATVGGGAFNQITGGTAGYGSSAIGGGYNNWILPNAQVSAIGGGVGNRINGDYNITGGSVIGGGSSNNILNNAPLSVIGGGQNNWITGDTYADGSSVVGGGQNNMIDTNSEFSVIGGGVYNTVEANSPYSAVGGGFDNQVGNQFATVPGGIDNVADGFASFAAGFGAQTFQAGTFVWADMEGGSFVATGPNQFLIRASGGVGVGTGTPQASVDIVSSNGVATPQLRLVQANSTDYSRLRFQTGAQPDWDLAMGGLTDQMNWYVPNYGNLMSLTTNGTLFTSGAINAGGTVSGAALTVNNGGAIRVSGAGSNSKTAAFVQTVNSGNYNGGGVTTINNPLCNGNPNAILMITRLWLNSTPDTSMDPVIVYYTAGQWEIISDTMNVGDTFNVLIILP